MNLTFNKIYNGKNTINCCTNIRVPGGQDGLNLVKRPWSRFRDFFGSNYAYLDVGNGYLKTG